MTTKSVQIQSKLNKNKKKDQKTEKQSKLKKFYLD